MRSRKQAAPAAIDGKVILRVYTGRQGCACGCRGNYSTRPATIRRVVSKIKSFPQATEEDGPNPQGKVYEIGGCCFNVDYDRENWRGGSPGRTATAYYDSAE